MILDIALTIYVTVISAGLSVLFWRRLDRMEERLADTATKDDLRAQGEDFRQEMRAVRSDVT